MVNLEWYRSFIQVYRVGTVSGAAQILYLTQPAVSQHIASLESALGSPLFVRTPRKMIPTEEGKRLYTQAVAAIEQLEGIALGKPTPNTPKLIRLGTPQEFFSEIILPRLALENRLLYKIEFGLASNLIDLLLEGKLDAAIATQKIESADLEYQSIFEENFWLVAPPNTASPVIPEILQEDLTQLEIWLRHQPWITYGEEMPIIRRFWRKVFGRRIDTNPKFIIPDLRGIRQAIALGLGFSVLPDYLCVEWVKNGSLTLILAPNKAISNHLWLAARKSARNSEVTQILLELLTGINPTVTHIETGEA